MAQMPRFGRSFDSPPGLVLWGLIVPQVLIEVVLQAADLGILGTPLWRGITYQNGAFWAGLLHNWHPSYAGQPVTMFVTYAVLHNGIGHLAGNMLCLLLLGGRLIRRLGSGHFLGLFFVSILGGGAGFGLLSYSAHPMIGASGGLFGLAGAWIWLEAADRHRFGLALWPVGGVILGLVVLNALMWLALDGVLAWETHLGGFVAGVAYAALRPGAAGRRA